MKKLILSAAFAVFAVMAFAQNESKFSDFMILNEANLKSPIKPKKNKNGAKMNFKTAIDSELKGEYKLEDGSTMKWVARYDKATKVVSIFGFDHSANNKQIQEQPLPANFWEKAQQSLTKGDEANQKLSIEALLKQVYK